MRIDILKIALLASATLLLACQGKHTQPKAELMVSIAPLKYVVEQITAGDFQVGVLVPSGASPETFDPTPRQIAQANDATLLFTTGLIEFEQNIVERLSKKSNVVALSNGIDLIEGEHSHHEEHAHQGHSHSHHHGTDPHIWISPKELKVVARNVYEAIMQQYPDSVKYTEAYARFDKELDSLDAVCRQLCNDSATTAFVVYHPALTYFARAYALEQIAIEDDGKEPSAKHIAEIIDASREKGVKCLLYQVQYPRSVVDVIARDMGVEPREFDPLKENVVESITEITRLITGTN